MEINVSEKTRIKIHEIARRLGRSDEEVAGELLGEKVMEVGLEDPTKKTLSDLAGMFYGGPGDTGERASEILRAELGLGSLGKNS